MSYGCSILTSGVFSRICFYFSYWILVSAGKTKLWVKIIMFVHNLQTAEEAPQIGEQIGKSGSVEPATEMIRSPPPVAQQQQRHARLSVALNWATGLFYVWVVLVLYFTKLPCVGWFTHSFIHRKKKSSASWFLFCFFFLLSSRQNVSVFICFFVLRYAFNGDYKFCIRRLRIVNILLLLLLLELHRFLPRSASDKVSDYFNILPRLPSPSSSFRFNIIINFI